MSPARAEERVFIGLGANLGPARATLAQAAQELGQLPNTQRVALSAFYGSQALGGEGPDYVNAVAELRTGLQPLELLAQLQAIEARHGRTRPHRNAPRTLDLDLLLFGQRALDSPALTLPHPRAHQRGFVLQPLLELAPDLHLPGLGPAAAFLPACAEQGVWRLP